MQAERQSDTQLYCHTACVSLIQSPTWHLSPRLPAVLSFPPSLSCLATAVKREQLRSPASYALSNKYL